MIRPATINDLRTVYDMMAAYFREAVDKGGYALRWDQGPAVLYLGQILEATNGLNFISENGEGLILGLMGETWFGKNPIAKPSALYVKPEHRNGLIARALLRRFEKEGRERGAVWILWEFESGASDPRMLAGIMERLGYEEQGPIYRKVFKEAICPG